MDQKKLKDFIKRRHPEYDLRVEHWNFVEATYEGGRSWFNGSNIFRYVKEGEKEFEDRLNRCYRFNHTREVVDLVDKYLFKVEIARNSENAPESVKAFWQKATLSGLSIDDLVRRISNRASTFGRVWVVVDNTKTGAVTSLKEEREAGVQTYAYIVPPQHALDMSYDDKGELNWILFYEETRDDEDPLNSDGSVISRYRLWTRTNWTLFTVSNVKSEKGKISIQGPIEHEFGSVPAFAADCVMTPDSLYSAAGLIDDVAYLDRAVANYLSNLDAIIQDQTFSQLAMPAQGLLPGEAGYDKLVEMGTKRIFTYDGQGGAAPFYLSPDVKQAQLILSIISKIINEIYHTVGLAGERTKEDNSQGIDNSSGVAKAYDFERVNSLLSAKADSLEEIENKLAHFVARWHGDEAKIKEELVAYPKNFDVRGLYDEFEIAGRLALIEAPDEVRREQMKAIIDKLFPKIAEDIKKKMLDELKTWPPKLEDLIAQGKVTPGSSKGGTASLKEIGQNTMANQLVKSS